MIDNCKLVYVDGVVNVFDNNGSTSSLYAQALEYTNGNQEEAVQIWSATQSEEFDLEVGEENPSLSTVLRFLNNRVSNPKSLSSEELKEVSLLMSDMGITDIDEFTQEMNKLFQPNGYYAVDTKKLMDSGMYSLKDISELDDIQVKTFLEKLNYFNEHKTYKLNSTPNKTKIQLRNTTAKKTPIGSFPLVSEQEFVEYVIDNSVDLTEPNILKTIGESPFSQILDDKKAMKAVMGMLQGRTKVNKMFFDGENFTSENIDTFVTLRNTLLANADPIELESDLEFIESIPQNIWESKQKQIRGVLKEIEQTAIKYNIDVIGISDLATDRASVMEILSALDDVLLAPSLENIKNFATKKDSKISPTKPYTVIELREEYKKYNIVKIDTNLSDDVMFQKGFLRVDSNGLYHRVQRTDVNAMYEVVYQRVLDNNLIIPSEYFAKDLAIKDANNKDAVIEGIKNYINSRDTGIESTLNEEISLFQTIFAHKSLENSKPQDIETNGDYLKSNFVSDFYNYILKEKQAKTDLYNKVLRYFSITDGDITLDALQTPDITGIKYEKELRDYSKLKKDGQIKELSQGESKNQDLAIINNPKTVNEEQGINFVTGNDGYILSEPNPNTYMKVGGKLYRKLFDKANGSLYKAVNLAKNTLYFDNNLNFSYDREEAESAYKNLNKTLQKTPTKSAKELAENVNIPTVLKPIQFSVAPTQNQVAIQRNNGNPLTLAPNGQPSILYQSYKDLGYSDSEAENLVSQVYSDEFISWFGNSKIVDENGQPLIVFHGTNAKFNEFSTEYGKYTDGTFFSTKKGTASIYGDIKPFFIKAYNVKEVGSSLPGVYDMGDIRGTNFDGLWNKGTNEVVVGVANQIKSATENVGTFSTDSNDIRYQIIGEQGASRMVEYKQQLDRAKQLETEGKTPAQIELETGWYKYKGDWRTIPKEVVESFQIKDRTVNKELTLKQVLGDDNTIFNFYPEIGGTKVIFVGEDYKNNPFENIKEQALGFFNAENGAIYINTSITNPTTGIRENITGFNQLKTLAHEVNHLIQSIEGFPTGGNMYTVAKKASEIVGIEFKDLQELYDKLSNVDLSKLSSNDKLIVTSTIDALDKLNQSGSNYGLTEQYNHLLGEIDSKIVEEAITFKDRNEFVPSYLQLLNRVTSLRGIALDNIIVVRDGNEGFKLNIAPKTIEKETVDQVINKLKQTGLSSEVFQLNTQQLQEKLKELGVSDDIAMQVIAWHGTKSNINRFSTDFIGTGNGNIFGGWGLYFSLDEGRAKGYANQLATQKVTVGDNVYEDSKFSDNFSVLKKLIEENPSKLSVVKGLLKEAKKEDESFKRARDFHFGGSFQEAYNKYVKAFETENTEESQNIIKDFETKERRFINDSKFFSLRKLARGILKDGAELVKTPAYLYEVSLPDTLNLLDFDKPIPYEQYKQILEQAEKEGSIFTERIKENINKKGSSFYFNVAQDTLGGSEKELSLLMARAGVDGNTMKSDGFKQDIIIFDENAITIEEQIQFQKALSQQGINLIPNGFIYKDQVFLNSESMTPETVMHEFFHLFSNWQKENRPEIYSKGLSLIEEELKKGDKSEIKDVFDFVNKNQPNLKGNALLEEYLAEFIGRYSKQMMDEQKAKSPLMQWLSDFWASVKEMLGINEMTPAQVANLSLRDYAKASVVTLSKGENFVGDNGEANFNRWKGENELVTGSEIQNVKTGQPIVVKGYHGTTNEFYEFDASVKGNIEGHLGKVNYFTSDYQDASQNYLAEGADITGRIDRRQDELEDTLRYDYQSSEEGLDFQRIIEDFNITDEEVENLYPSGKPEFIQAEEISRFLAEKEIKGETEQILDVFIKLNNPVVLGNGATWFETLDIDEVYMQGAVEEIAEEYDITEEEAKNDYEWEVRDRAVEKQGDSNKIVSALERALDDNGYDQAQVFEILGDNYYEAEVDLNKLEESIRKSELYDNYDGELASSQVIADFFKNLGFDGIILTDVSQRFSGMRLSTSTSHIHVFDEYNNQIKLADGSNTTFNPKTSDIRFQKVVHDARVTERASVFQLINDFGIVIKNLYPKSQENEIKDKFDECRI